MFSVKKSSFHWVLCIHTKESWNVQSIRSFPSKHLLVMKVSSARLRRSSFTSSKASSRRLQDILQDVLKTCLEDVLKTGLEDVLKTQTKYGEKQHTYWLYLCLTNLNMYLTDLYFTSLCLTILKCVNYSSFQYLSYFETQAASLFQELKSLMTVSCCEISWIQIRHCKKGETIKTNS